MHHLHWGKVSLPEPRLVAIDLCDSQYYDTVVLGHTCLRSQAYECTKLARECENHVNDNFIDTRDCTMLPSCLIDFVRASVHVLYRFQVSKILYSTDGLQLWIFRGHIPHMRSSTRKDKRKHQKTLFWAPGNRWPLPSPPPVDVENLIFGRLLIRTKKKYTTWGIERVTLTCHNKISPAH